MRYLVPLILGIAAAYVWNFNATHETQWLLVPFLDAIPALEGDRDAQAEWSWRILAGIAALVLLWTVVDDVRDRRRARDAFSDSPQD